MLVLMKKNVKSNFDEGVLIINSVLLLIRSDKKKQHEKIVYAPVTLFMHFFKISVGVKNEKANQINAAIYHHFLFPF